MGGIALASDKRCCHWHENSLVLKVHGTPAAKRDAIGKVHGEHLKVSITAAPEDGKASEAMRRFLAREFGVKAKDVELVLGATSVHKLFRIHAPRKIPSVVAEVLQGERPDER